MDDLLETLRCTLCGHREERVVKKRATLPLCVQCPGCRFIAWRNDPYCVSLLGEPELPGFERQFKSLAA